MLVAGLRPGTKADVCCNLRAVFLFDEIPNAKISQLLGYWKPWPGLLKVGYFRVLRVEHDGTNGTIGDSADGCGNSRGDARLARRGARAIHRRRSARLSRQHFQRFVF